MLLPVRIVSADQESIKQAEQNEESSENPIQAPRINRQYKREHRLYRVFGHIGLGLRNMDGAYGLYTFPLHDRSASSFGSAGPQIGLASFKKNDYFLGYGLFDESILTAGASLGFRYSDLEKLRMHFQFGLGMLAHLTTGLTTNFVDNHQLHVGVEINIPIFLKR